MCICHTLVNMRSKMNFVLLCAFGLFAIVHSQEPRPDELKKYSQCYEYGLCKDPSTKRQIISCLNPLAPKEFQSLFQNFKQNFYPLMSDTLSGAISEYCGSSDATENKLADKVIDADFHYQKKNAAQGDESVESELEQATNCVYKIAQKLQSEGKC